MKVWHLILAIAVSMAAAPAYAQVRFGGGSAYGGGMPMGGGMGMGGSLPMGGMGAPMGGGMGMGGSLPMGAGSMPFATPGSPGHPSLIYGGTPGFGYGYNYGGWGFRQVPIPIGGSAYFHIGNLGVQYWRAPSGYYYPWGMGAAAVAVPTPIYYVNQGASYAQKPPLSTMFSDMQKYLDQSKKDNRLSDADYQHLYRRLQDLQAKYFHDETADGDAEDSGVRKDAEMLSAEIARDIKALPSTGSP